MLKSDVLKFAGSAASALAAAFATLGSMGSHRRVRTLRGMPLRPTGAALRNPADPFQAERIERAAAKRQRKGQALMANTGRATIFNRAHENSDHHGYQQTPAWAGGRLNPLFVNR